MQVSRSTHQAGLYRALGSRQGGFAARAAQLRTPRAGWFGYAEPKAPGRAALARTRFIEAQLRAALADGIAQVVWLGTEYPAPAELAGIQLGEDELLNLARPSADPGALEMALASRGLDAAQRCIFVWDGMLERVDAASVQRVLSCIGRACPGSRFVFTYLHRGLLDGSVRRVGAGAAAGFATGLIWRPRAVPTGVAAASSGSSVMPWPVATIWRSVSRLVAR